jgi:hypothetical protein
MMVAMEGFELVLAALLVSVAGLNAVASRIGVPTRSCWSSAGS